MEIDISCLLKEPVCHLLAYDFEELVLVLQTFIFGRGMVEHQPYLSLLKFGICLQVVAYSSTYYSQHWVSTMATPHAMAG